MIKKHDKQITFLSDSFPLDANGGGMKDGTYLQTSIKDEPPTQYRLLEWREGVKAAINFGHSIPAQFSKVACSF